MNCGFAMRIGLKSHVKAVQGEDDNTLPQLPQSYHSASAVESKKLYVCSLLKALHAHDWVFLLRLRPVALQRIAFLMF
jgi:hypothetical protein